MNSLFKGNHNLIDGFTDFLPQGGRWYLWVIKTNKLAIAEI